MAAVLQEGAGHKYLIQHSAGSGKTNSIAWTVHFLADFHDTYNHSHIAEQFCIVTRVVALRRLCFGLLQRLSVQAHLA